MYVLEGSDCAILSMKLPNKEAKASAGFKRRCRLTMTALLGLAPVRFARAYLSFLSQSAFFFRKLCGAMIQCPPLSPVQPRPKIHRKEVTKRGDRPCPRSGPISPNRGAGKRGRGLCSLRNKSGQGKDMQGLKPNLFSVFYGPTKVVVRMVCHCGLSDRKHGDQFAGEMCVRPNVEDRDKVLAQPLSVSHVIGKNWGRPDLRNFPPQRKKNHAGQAVPLSPRGWVQRPLVVRLVSM